MACAQCLALKGSTDAKVVNLIIQMLLDADQHEQATALLIHLSQYTVRPLLVLCCSMQNFKLVDLFNKI